MMEVELADSRVVETVGMTDVEWVVEMAVDSVVLMEES